MTSTGWIPLSDLPNGAVFETKDGVRAVKSEYCYDNDGAIECVLLASGEYAHFAQGIADSKRRAKAHNATMVRPLAVVSTEVRDPGESEFVAAMRTAFALLEQKAALALSLGQWEAFADLEGEIIRLRERFRQDRSVTPDV